MARSCRSIRTISLLAVATLACGALTADNSKPVELERQAYLMGTRARLATYAVSRERGLARLEGFLEILEATERELSTWREETALARLNHTPLDESAPLDPPLCHLFAELTFWQRETARAFDPAIGSLAAAWDIRGRGRVPTHEALERARRSSGLEHFHFDRDSCTVRRDAPAVLDEGAFGKGEALDRVARSSASMAPWLIDLGGQIMVGSSPPGTSSWSVALAHPTDRDKPVLTLTLPYGSLATSGGSERDRIASAQRIGHILDPRSGRPAGFTGTVTVWHERALRADILSTALFVMGVEEGIKWADARAIAACYLIPIETGDRVSIRASRAFTDRFGMPANWRMEFPPFSEPE